MNHSITQTLRISVLALSLGALLACGTESDGDEPGSSSSTANSSNSQSSSSGGDGTVHGCTLPTSCEPGNGGNIEVLCPAAGGTFAPGDSIVLGWRAEQADFTGYRPQISINGGQSYLELAEESVFAEDELADFACVTYGIRVPSDTAWTSDQVVFRVRDYNSAMMRDQTAGHTILAP